MCALGKYVSLIPGEAHLTPYYGFFGRRFKFTYALRPRDSGHKSDAMKAKRYSPHLVPDDFP